MTIASPVSRLLGAADLERTLAFYRDILGFDIRERDGAKEAVRGPARLRFESHDFAPGSWDDPQPPGTAFVYFDVKNAAEAREEITGRGGESGAIGKLNWVKLIVFEVRDPDGRTLIFGESFDFPHSEHPNPMLVKALPSLPVSGVAAAVNYYRDILGFRINYQQEDLGVMDRDNVTLLLHPAKNEARGAASFYIRNADQLYAELAAKGARVQGSPVSEPWGLRVFEVLDLDGNRLAFCQTFE